MRRACLVALATAIALSFPATGHAHELRLPGAPAFVETTGPAGHRAVVITVHGGGWFMTGPRAAAGERPSAQAWAARGWTAVNTSYRPRGDALRDVLHVYDRVRRHVGPSTPVCLAGSSAGGHLALMVAARRRDVDCVVARGAPTDLVTIHRHFAWGPHGPQRSGPRQVRKWAIEAFGREGLGAMSPARQAHRIRARVLLAVGDRDPVVAPAQVAKLARALPRARVMRLAAGDVGWVHGPITRAAAAEVARAELALADAAYSSS